MMNMVGNYHIPLSSHLPRVVQWIEREEIIKACAESLKYRETNKVKIISLPHSALELWTKHQNARLEKQLHVLRPKTSRRKHKRKNILKTDYENFTNNLIVYKGGSDILDRRLLLKIDIAEQKEVFPVDVYSDTFDDSLPSRFKYITENDYSNFHEIEDCELLWKACTVKCDCSGPTCFTGCSCLNLNEDLGSATLFKDGRVVMFRHFYDSIIVGCGPACACRGKCNNALGNAILPAPFRFEVFKRDNNLGFGLRTLSNIEPGCAVTEFVGEVIDEVELQSRSQSSHDYSFLLLDHEENWVYEKLSKLMAVETDNIRQELRRKVFIDPSSKGNLTRFISHACWPNLIPMRYAANDLRPHHFRVVLFASQPILAGSELFFDYGEVYGEMLRQHCLCNTMLCGNKINLWNSVSMTNKRAEAILHSHLSWICENMAVYYTDANKLLIKKHKKNSLDDLNDLELDGPPIITVEDNEEVTSYLELDLPPRLSIGGDSIENNNIEVDEPPLITLDGDESEGENMSGGNSKTEENDESDENDYVPIRRFCSPPRFLEKLERKYSKSNEPPCEENCVSLQSDFAENVNSDIYAPVRYRWLPKLYWWIISNRQIFSTSCTECFIVYVMTGNQHMASIKFGIV